MHVYMIVNSVDGKIYIGKTVRPDLQKYFREKIKRAVAKNDLRFNRGRNYLATAIRKHGADKFSVFPLISTLTTDKELCYWEMRLIAEFNTQDHTIGYNITQGGEGTAGLKWSEMSCAKKSKSMIGNKRCLGHRPTRKQRKKTSETLMKHPVSEETRKKIKAARAKQPNPSGWHHAEEAKTAISGALRSRRLSPSSEFKPGQTAWNKNKKMSEEYRAKCRERGGPVKKGEKRDPAIGRKISVTRKRKIISGEIIMPWGARFGKV